MPNWVWNNLTIKKEDRHYVLNNDGEVDFNILLPMPEDLSRTISGGSIRDCIAYFFLSTKGKDEFLDSYWYREIEMFYHFNPNMSQAEMLDIMRERIGHNPEMFNDEKYDEEHGHTILEIGSYYCKLWEKYSVYDWYQWRNKHWGCKWNASDTEIRDNDDGTVLIAFTTPWCSPYGWLNALADKIPFHLAWEEEQGYRGIIFSDGNGGINEDYLEELEWEEDEYGDLVMKDTQFEGGEDWTNYRLNEVF